MSEMADRLKRVIAAGGDEATPDRISFPASRWNVVFNADPTKQQEARQREPAGLVCQK
ncbi:hypothetical protein ACE102_21910 [Bradyrhizobium sp. vgs-9]|uniref:hypothetical protein n=1 Tax=Bradyrhizobium sp. vgs-9 TaxID=208389 RepID=UPI0035D4D47C